MKLIGVKVGDQVRNRVQKLADSKGVSLSSMARELLEQALNRQDLGQAIAVLVRDIQAMREAQINHEQLIRRVGRATAKGVWTTEEFARVLITDPRKYESMIQAVQRAQSSQGKKE